VTPELISTIAAAIGVCASLWRAIVAIERHMAAVDRLTDAVEELQHEAREHGWPLQAAGVR
jgi:hypothetical protein